MENNYVAIMKCQFCGKDTNCLAINRRLQNIEGNVFDNEPCDKCKKMLDGGKWKFFIGDCGHGGYIKTKALFNMLAKTEVERLRDSKIFRMESCFMCLDKVEIKNG